MFLKGNKKIKKRKKDNKIIKIKKVPISKFYNKKIVNKKGNINKIRSNIQDNSYKGNTCINSTKLKLENRVKSKFYNKNKIIEYNIDEINDFSYELAL